MAIYYYPFESHETGDDSNPYDRAITAEQERMFNKLRYTNGVFNPGGGALRVASNSNMTVTVGTGGCHIEGAIAYNDAPVTLPVEAAKATLNRIDRVVAQLNTSDSVRAVSILVRTGVAATNPIPPELRTEPNLYELALADIRVGKGASSIGTADITDQRLNSALCGQVVPAIPTPIDTTGLWEQYQASLNEWLGTVADALDGTLAGNLQNQVTALKTRLEAEETRVQPIAKGGTGATTVAKAQENLGIAISAETVKMFADAGYPITGGAKTDRALQQLMTMAGAKTEIELLWQNASPTSAFANQTVRVDLSGYGMAMVICNANTGMPTRAMPPVLSTVPGAGIVTGNRLSADASPYVESRYFKCYKTYVQFDDCTAANQAVPIQVYGIKL